MIIPEENGGEQGVLAKHAKKIFLSSKPAPVLESKFKDSDQFQLGTLSHIIGGLMDDMLWTADGKGKWDEIFTFFLPPTFIYKNMFLSNPSF